ncbi:MAG: hypothetical protein ACXAE3_17400, partial [Candidatus Kariarchaeaceae archaeon]
MNVPTFLIPVRGLKTAMTRIRQHVEDEQVDHITLKLLNNTVQCLREASLPFVILTADKAITKELYQSDVIYDSGEDLNNAMEHAISRIDGDYFGIIMPDLPGLTLRNLRRFLSIYQIHGSVVIPTEDEGTAMAILKRSYFAESFFGPRSSSKIIEYANQQSDGVAKLIVEELKRDLD